VHRRASGSGGAQPASPTPVRPWEQQGEGAQLLGSGAYYLQGTAAGASGQQGSGAQQGGGAAQDGSHMLLYHTGSLGGRQVRAAPGRAGLLQPAACLPALGALPALR
jgi:hypothetical protein